MNTKKLVNLIKIACLDKIIYILGVSSISILMALPSTALKYPKLCERQETVNQNKNYRSENTDSLTTLEEEDEFKNLVYELEQAKLAKKITTGNYIILAPNDEAFEALSDDEFEKYFGSANQDKTLKYHLIDPNNGQQDNSGDELMTLAGDKLLFSQNNGQLTIDIANAKYPCITTTNGLVIEIDKVLVPADLKN